MRSGFEEVITGCPRCGQHFVRTTGPGVEAPDCPNCGFDATGREAFRKVTNKWLYFEGHTDRVQSARFSCDGRLVASGGRDCVLRVWDVATRTQLVAFPGHRAEITGVAFLPDGSKVMSSAGDTTLRLWDLDTKQECGMLAGHTDWVQCVDVSPDGKTAVSGGDDSTIRFWDIDTLTQRFSLSTPCRVNALSFSSNGQFVASADRSGTVSILNAHTGAIIHALHELDTEDNCLQPFSVAFSPDSAQVASCNGDVIKLWDVASAHLQGTLDASMAFEIKGFTHSTMATAIAFSRDETTLVSVGSNYVQIWDLPSMRCRKVLKGHSRGLFSVCFSPSDTNMFVTGGDNVWVNLRSVKEPMAPESVQKKWWQFWKWPHR